MRHELFGELKYERGETAWSGALTLPRLVAFGRRTQNEGPDFRGVAADLRDGPDRALERTSDWLRRRVEVPTRNEGTARIPGLSEEREAALDRAAERKRADERIRLAGAFPIRIEAPPDEGPTAAQEIAGRLLVEREDEVCRAILEALFDSYKQYYEHERNQFADESLRQKYGLPVVAGPEGLAAVAQLLGVRIPRLRIEGAAPLVFRVDCDWECEHGMFLVHHRDLGVEWTTIDGLHKYELLDDGAGAGD